jgi:hypothetical protein
MKRRQAEIRARVAKRQSAYWEEVTAQHLLRAAAVLYAVKDEADGFVRPLVREEGAPEALLSL